jgi:hypothetical protein
MRRGPLADTKLESMFALYIELGNDAMCSPDDIAEALEKVAKKVRGGATDGRIVDVNGNVVGEFEQEGP